MITNQKELISFIDKVLKPFHFVRKEQDWYYKTNECVVALGIGKSNWSGEYTIVLATLVRDIEDVEFPKLHQCHFHGFGLESLVTNRNELRRSLNLEEKFFSDEREDVIQHSISNVAIPFLYQVSTIAGIKRAIDEHGDLKYHVILKLKDWLNVN